MPASLDCPGIESWRALFSGTLLPHERELCERHLESCPACQERLDRTEECGDPLLELGREVGDPTIAPGDPTLVHVLERLHEMKRPDPAACESAPDLFFLRPSDRPDLLGTLAGYEITEIIGEGGMGIVLKAFEPALHRPVAIKVMSTAIAGSATARRRFIREAQAAAAVSHEHIVAVHAVSEEAGLPYLVMQYIAGESLQAQLDREAPLKVEEAVRIGRQTALGLAAAHAEGLIHRDIKPANLLLGMGNGEWGMGNEEKPSAHSPFPIPHSPFGAVKITDFGLARMVDDVALTQLGVVAGTPEYMSPEQARAEPVDHRSDLFSLGTVLYAMCTGVSPFRGSNTMDVLRRVCEQEPIPVRSLNAGVPEWLEGLIARLMSKDPAGRFQSAAEVAELLADHHANTRQSLTMPPPLSVRDLNEDKFDVPLFRMLTRSLNFLSLGIGFMSLLILAWLAFAFQGVDDPKASKPELAKEYRLSLKGDMESNPGLELAGPSAENCVNFEPEGLRITLAPGWNAVRNNTGVRLPLPIKGDFEVTVHFEILHEPTLQEAGVQQTRITLGVNLVKEGINAATISRRIGGNASQFFAWMRIQDATTGKPRERAKGFATAAKSGSLRLSRAGPVVSYLAAEGSDTDFVLLQQYLVGAEDVDGLHIAGSTGNARSSLDVRITDLRIRAGSLPDLLATSSDGRGWLIAPGIVCLVITLLLCVCTFLLLRQQQNEKNDESGS